MTKRRKSTSIQQLILQQWKILYIYQVQPEEMWFLRLAKLLHKLFWTQFLFGSKIKSTYKNALENTEILDMSVKRGSQRPIKLLGPRQKWVDLPPTFFELFINFLIHTETFQVDSIRMTTLTACTSVEFLAFFMK